MQDLENCERLRRRQQRMVDLVEKDRERRMLDRDEVHCVECAGGPQREGNKVVGEEVEARWEGHRVLWCGFGPGLSLSSCRLMYTVPVHEGLACFCWGTCPMELGYISKMSLLGEQSYESIPPEYICLVTTVDFINMLVPRLHI